MRRLRHTRSTRPRRAGPHRTRWRVALVLAMVTLIVVLAALRREGFDTEARLLHLTGWSLLTVLGVSDGLRRLRGAAGALGDGRGALDRGLGLAQTAVCLAMLLGLVPFPL